jgi:hypothetical protein
MTVRNLGRPNPAALRMVGDRCYLHAAGTVVVEEHTPRCRRVVLDVSLVHLLCVWTLEGAEFVGLEARVSRVLLKEAKGLENLLVLLAVREPQVFKLGFRLVGKAELERQSAALVVNVEVGELRERPKVVRHSASGLLKSITHHLQRDRVSVKPNFSRWDDAAAASHADFTGPDFRGAGC